MEVKFAQWHLQESNWDESEAAGDGARTKKEQKDPLPLGVEGGERGGLGGESSK